MLIRTQSTVQKEIDELFIFKISSIYPFSKCVNGIKQNKINNGMEFNHPLISCICVTSHRITFLKRAIKCFETQLYPFKELIVCYPDNDLITINLIKDLVYSTRSLIIPVERFENDSLGCARNLAISKSNGDYICIWDDDDWYHPQRLFYQFEGIQLSSNYEASILSRLILFDYPAQRAYLSFYYIWEGTLMCKRNFFLDHMYSDETLGEDSIILDHLDNNNLLYHIQNLPFLYIYIFHNNNTWDKNHFNEFYNRSQLLNQETTSKIKIAVEFD